MVLWWILGAGFPIDTGDHGRCWYGHSKETPIGLWARQRDSHKSGPQSDFLLDIGYSLFLSFWHFLVNFSPGINCGTPSSTNINPVANTRFNGSSVTITCENGYQVEGTTETTFQSTCQASGLWSQQLNCVGEFVTTTLGLYGLGILLSVSLRHACLSSMFQNFVSSPVFLSHMIIFRSLHLQSTTKIPLSPFTPILSLCLCLFLFLYHACVL